MLVRSIALCVLGAALGAPALAANPPAASPQPASPQPASPVQIVDVTSSPSPVTGMQLFLAAGLDRQPRDRSGLAAMVAQALIETPVDGVPLSQAIANAGGSIDFAVDAQETHFYLEATPANFGAVASLFARALAQPKFDPAAVKAAAAEVAKRAQHSSGDGLAVGVEMFRSVYLAKTNAGLPTWGNPATIAQITPSDVAGFFHDTYVAQGAMIVAGGLPVPGLADGERAVTQALPDRAPAAVVASGQRPLEARSRELIAHRSVSAPWVVLGYPAPAPGSPDFAAALVVQSLIGQAVGRGLAPPTVATPTETERPVGSLYLFDTVPSAVVVYANGAGANPTLSVRTVASVIGTLSSAALSKDELSLVKAEATGEYLREQATIADRTWLAGNFDREGAGGDYAARVPEMIAAVTPAQLRQAAKRYFAHYTTAIVLPREEHP